MPPECKIADEIRSYALLTEGNLFEELLASVRFEDVGKGRQGAVLAKIDETGRIPIVRTTTRYSAPAQRFRPVHEQLAQQIQKSAALLVGFNNALIENYTHAYTTMGSHSDQALDLADESLIALFSCYEHPERANPPRKLLVESKGVGGDQIAISLIHNSVVVFSVDANRRLKHKIVLDTSTRTPENRWLGITFRTSKTFVRFRDGCAYFPDDDRLTLADDEQRREFYHLRRRENNETGFTYPRITYTISESDMMPPEPIENSRCPPSDRAAGSVSVPFGGEDSRVRPIGNDPGYTAAGHFAAAGCDLDRACKRLAGWRGGALGLPAFECDSQRNWSGEWSWGEARGPTIGVNVTQVHRVGDAREWAFLTEALPGASTYVSVFWAAEAAQLVDELERELPSLLGGPIVLVRRRG